MLIKFAFRNILRNKRRSFLTALSIFFAAMIVGLAQGWINGMFDSFVEDYVKYQTGHVRVVTEEYKMRERFFPVNEIIYNSKELISDINNIEHVKKIEERIRFGMLIAYDEKTSDSVGYGIDLMNNSFDLNSKLKEGKLKSEGIYIGHLLAEKIGVKLGDKILIAAKTSEGGLNGIKVQVNGILQFGVGSFDKKFFFISKSDAKKLLKIYTGTTEIYVFADHINNSKMIKKHIKEKAGDGYSVETYSDQMGPFYQTFQSGKIFYIFIEILIMLLASFVVINTITMSIFERMREIGTLKAIGMTDNQLFGIFTIEGGIIGAIGGTIGALCGYLIIVYFSVTGVNLSEMLGGMEIPVQFIVKPRLHFLQPVSAVIISIVVPAIASMIPSRKIKKYFAADALRE